VDVSLIDHLCCELQAVAGAQFTAGIVLGERLRVGAAVVPGDLLATVYAEERESGERVATRLQDAFPLYQGGMEVTPKPPILAECWLEGDESREVVAWQRVSQAALGLISREQQGKREYLLRYNRRWGAWSRRFAQARPAGSNTTSGTL